MIRKENITLLVGCTKQNLCNDPKNMPSSGSFYTEAPRGGGFQRMIDEESARYELDFLLMDFEITQHLPTGLEYVDDSAQPEPIVETKNDRTLLRWNWGGQDATKVHTVTYRVMPREEGNWGVDGALGFANATELTRTIPLPSLAITVAGKCDEIKTPTPKPPTDTPVPPTFTPTPTETPVPATPTMEPGEIYLPIALKIPCHVDYYGTDVALVLDLSTSMRDETRAGRSKLDASLEQAKRFVSQMQFDPEARGGRPDQVAVVGFNAEAWIEEGLTLDDEAIAEAIDRLRGKVDQHTRLDLALEMGSRALESDAHLLTNTKVIILLTDGLPDQVPYDPDDGTMETTVLRAAAAAKQAGARIYTIAIGAEQDTNQSLLTAIATHPDLCFYEPDPEDLERVYSEIVGSFGCPMSRLEWPGPWPEVAP